MISPFVWLLGQRPQKENLISVKIKENMITVEQIKELRNRTGVSVIQCKKALEESDGDMSKALVILHKKSGEISSKRADKNFGAGVIQAYIHMNGTIGTLVELNCETDFVANNEEFGKLAYDIAMHVAASNPKYLDMSEVSATDKQKAKEVFEKEVKGDKQEVREQIIEGKLKSYFSEMVLLEQSFIKNPDLTIKNLIETASQKFGEKMQLGRFIRFKVLEK